MLKYFIIFLCFQSSLTKIKTLTDANAENYINSNKIVFLKIYTKWCSHSKSLKKPFEQLSKDPEFDRIVFAEIDGEKNKEIQKKLKATGFPNLFIFINGFKNHTQYFGPIDTTDTLSSYLRNLLEKHIHVYKSEYIYKLKKDDHFMGYGLFCGEEGTEEYDSLLLTLQLLDAIKVFKLKKNECSDHGLENNQLIYIKASGEKIIFSRFDKLKELKIFLKYAKYEAINPFNVELVGESIGAKIPLLVYFDQDINKEHIRVLKSIYPSIKNNFIIMQNRLKTNFEREYAEILGITTKNAPALMIVIIQEKITKFKLEKTFTIKSVGQFLYDFLHNKLETHLISEKETEDDENVYLKNVNSQNMRNLLLNKKLDKIILFYTNNCQGCPDALKTVEKIAKKFLNTNIYFGKINVAKNEVPDMTNIPGLAFFDRLDPNRMDFYKGNLDEEKMKKWILDKHERKVIDTDL